MRTLRELLDDPFFDLLDSAAEEARQSVCLLGSLAGSDVQDLKVFTASRRKSERIAADIDARLANTIMASLRKEDIQDLSRALRAIPESVERLAERFCWGKDQVGSGEFTRLVQSIGRAVDALVCMVAEIRGDENLGRIQQLHAQVEGVADEIEQSTEAILQGIYSHEKDPVRVVAAKDVLEHVQEVAQRCSECAELLDEIVLKYL